MVAISTRFFPPVLAAFLLSCLFAAPTRAGGGLLDDENRFVPDQLIVKLRPDAARVAPRALRDGFGQLLGDPSAASLDALCRDHGVRTLRRLVRELERPDGTLRMTTRELVERGRGAHPGRRGRVPADVPDLENVFVLELDPGADLLAALAGFSADPRVAYAHPNFIYRADAEPLPVLPYLPNDRYVTQDGATWSEGAFQQDFPDLFGLRNLQAIEAWNTFDSDHSGDFDPGETVPGEGVVVAVVDSGLDPSHPDIAANVWTNPGEIADNGIDDDGNGFVDDVSGWDFVNEDNSPADGAGHGTHVSGTIAALGDNAIGVIGVAPAARILPVKGLSDGGSGTDVQLANSVLYAVAMGADIINNSWGGPVDSPTIAAAFEAADAAGVLSIASAGNSNRDVLSAGPARLDTVMAVAATDHQDVRASFSNYGRRVEISAPGVAVLSLNAYAGDNLISGWYPERVVDTDYLYLNGTSMSAPHVSGTAAVLMSRFPDESGRETRGRLRAGADPIDDLNPGFEGLLGSGRVNLDRSLAATPAPDLSLVAFERDGFAPGNLARLVVRVKNFWLGVEDVTAVLATSHPDVAVIAGSASLGDIGVGETASNELEPFSLFIGPSLSFGDVIPLTLTLDSSGGHHEVVTFELSIPFFENITSRAGLLSQTSFPWRVVLQDYTGDGHEDVFLADMMWSVLFRSKGDATFEFDPNTDAISGIGNHPLFIDIDNDGDKDLFNTSINDNKRTRLWRNNGDGTFTDISATGVPSMTMTFATALDYDGDGFTDVLAGGADLNDDGVNWWEGLVLLRNDGGSRLSEVSGTGLPSAPFEFPYGQLATLDYDEDGDTDVMYAESETGIALFENDGNGGYSDVTASAFPFPLRDGGSGIAVGDYDNDTHLDVFVTGYKQVAGSPPNALFRNRGDGSFEDVTAAAGDLAVYNIRGIPWGNEFFDYDNDGDLDLYVTHDTPFIDDDLVTPPGNVLFRNNGDGTFSSVNQTAFDPDFIAGGAAAAIGDVDNDGALDLYAPSGTFLSGTAGGLLRNLQTGNSWIEIFFESSVSNPGAYGARVEVVAGGSTQVREVRTSAVDPSFVHFGLGQATHVDSIVVRWPSGVVRTIEGIAANRRLTVAEEAPSCGEGGDDDADGVCNAADNCVAIGNGPFDPSNQIDSDLDGIGNACDQDYDQDGAVSGSDFLIFATAWGLGLGDEGYDPRADATGDDVISGLDFLAFAGAFGGAPGPSGLACADPSGATAPCTAE